MSYPLLVSIILPTYNRATYIRKAIESVLSQTYRGFELIIIDDGSTDETPKIISEFKRKDARVKCMTNKPNIGLVKSLNKGVKNAQGKYIARLDDDDFWCDKGKLEKQVKFLENNPSYVAVGGGVIRVDATGKETSRHLLSENDKDLKNSMLLNNSFVHSTVVFKKEIWEMVGGFDESLDFSEDWDLWLRFGKIGKFYNFQQYFVRYLQDRQNKSNYNIQHNARLNIKLRKKYRNDYPNFWKAYILGWAQYIYTFLPFRIALKPIFSKLRRIIFGHPGYKSFVGKT
ncbi:glycosyltransferase [Candidatus Parcubacteria bacterium]|nr:glycosyltransferase [Candidatus Parcubacteria bacterium]